MLQHRGCCCKTAKLDVITPADLKTGDVILVREPQFAAIDNFILQNLCCWGANHVGIALRPIDFPPGSHIRARYPHLDNDRCYILHVIVSGVKIWEVERYIRRQSDSFSKGVVYVRRLQAEDSDDSTRGERAMRFRLVTGIDALYGEVRDRPFERNWWSIIQSFFDSCERCGICLAPRDLSSVFCSELVAEALQRSEVLDPERSSAEFLPLDFLRSDGKRVERSDFINGITLAPLNILRSGLDGVQSQTRDVMMIPLERASS